MSKNPQPQPEAKSQGYKETPKNPPQAKTKGQFYKKKGRRRFRPGQRGAPPPGQKGTPPAVQKGAPPPAQKPTGSAPGSTSTVRPISPGKQPAVPAQPTQVRREIKRIGIIFGALILLLFIFAQLLPHGAYIQAVLIGFLLLLFVFVTWRIQ